MWFPHQKVKKEGKPGSMYAFAVNVTFVQPFLITLRITSVLMFWFVATLIFFLEFFVLFLYPTSQAQGFPAAETLDGDAPG